MTDAPKSAIARLHGQDGGVVGAGFLVDATHVLTCAHVVAQALGIPANTTDAPTGELKVEFPFIKGGGRLQARVKAWFAVEGPTSGDGVSDIAVIELDGPIPAGATAAPLATMKDYWGRQFRAFGFPPGFDAGTWASGLLVDENAAGWVQIEDVKSTGYFVVPGFSGTLVWDVDAGAVVGVVVGADARPEVRAAFMIPSPLLAHAWPGLEGTIAEPPETAPQGMGKVVALLDTPDVPDFEHIPAENFSDLFGSWLLMVIKGFFDDVEIAIDLGSSDDVGIGDYFAIIAAEEVIKDAKGDVLGSVIKDGSLMRAVQVQSEMSTCTLTDFVYKAYFAQIDSVVEGFADADGNLDLALLAGRPEAFWPIQIGQRVMRIPPEEKHGRDEVEELYARTLDDKVSDDERRFLFGEMVRQANAFLNEHANGYFASAVLFQRGYAQFKLEQYRDAIDTFRLFLRRYPFSPSASGAREWIDKAETMPG